MLHGFAILTSLCKWGGMEILPDQADLVQQGLLIIITTVKISLASHIPHRSVKHPKSISCPAHYADLPGICFPAEAGPPSSESKYWHPK